MKLLLDSHIFLWWAGADPRLGKRAESLLAENRDIFVSAASWWELAIKQVLGRLRFDIGATSSELQKRGVRFLTVTFEHAEAAGALPAFHGDPFDHMLVAQASFEGLTLLTRDKKLKAYGPSVLCV